MGASRMSQTGEDICGSEADPGAAAEPTGGRRSTGAAAEPTGGRRSTGAAAEPTGGRRSTGAAAEPTGGRRSTGAAAEPTGGRRSTGAEELRPLAAVLGKVDDVLAPIPRGVAGPFLAFPARPDARVEPREQQQGERGDQEGHERVASAVREIRRHERDA